MRKNYKYSHAYNKFESTIERSLNIAELKDVVDALTGLTENLKEKNYDSSDMLRTSIVLAVAAMDSYFTDIFSEKVVCFIQKKHINPNLEDLLIKAGIDIKTLLKIMVTERPFRRIRTIISNYMSYRVTQNIKAIDDLFEKLGIKKLSIQIENLKKRKTLLKSVSDAVNRRHLIVHNGDIDSHRKTKNITIQYTKTKINDILKFVSGAEEIIQKTL